MSKFISFFASVRLTIVLLVLIAAFSVVGTFLPQQEEAAILLARLSPEAARWLEYLRVFDLYHSPLFLALMGLFSANLIICSLKRFPSSWKRMHPQPFPPPKELFPHLPPDQMLSTGRQREEVAGILETLLNKRLGKIEREESDREVFFFWHKGRYGHLGVYAIHAGILIIIAGALIGSLFGFEGYVTLDEGQSTREVEVKGGGNSRILDFSIRCDRFVLEFYDNGMPKTYRSDLSFIREGKVVHQGTVLVNHPISFGGLRFYQSSYSSSSRGKALLSYSVSGGKSHLQILTEGAVFKLPERDASATVLRIEENMMNMGPAVNLRIVSAKGDTVLWVFQHIEEMKQSHPGLLSDMPVLNPGLFPPYLFSLQRVEFSYATGLQAMSDPGVPLVAAGGFLMIFGFLITFGITHRRFWIRIDEARKTTRIAVAGKSSRASAGLSEETRQLCNSIREAINS